MSDNWHGRFGGWGSGRVFSQRAEGATELLGWKGYVFYFDS